MGNCSTPVSRLEESSDRRPRRERSGRPRSGGGRGKHIVKRPTLHFGDSATLGHATAIVTALDTAQPLGGQTSPLRESHRRLLHQRPNPGDKESARIERLELTIASLLRVLHPDPAPKGKSAHPWPVTDASHKRHLSVVETLPSSMEVPC